MPKSSTEWKSALTQTFVTENLCRDFLEADNLIKILVNKAKLLLLLWDAFQYCRIWAWNLVIGKSSTNCTYTLSFYENELYGQRFPKYGTIFKITIFGEEHGHWQKFHKLHIYSLSAPGGQNWAYFCSASSSFRDTGRFSKFPYLGRKLGHYQNIESSEVGHILPFYPGGVKLRIFLLYGQWFLR